MSALQDHAALGAVDNRSIKRGGQWLPVQVPSFGVVLCAQEVSGKHQNVVNLQHRALRCGKNPEKVLHEVLFMVVGQDSGDIPVPRGQGLKDVRARVGLEENQRLQ